MLSIFFGLLVSLNGISQKAVYQLPISSETTINNQSFFYTLPKTAFKVDVIVTKMNHIKGLYADFAEKMLGITNYCKENESSYKLKKIVLTPFTVPDESLQFVVELSSNQMKNNLFLSLYSKNTVFDYHLSSKPEQSQTDILPDFFLNYANIVLQQTYETYTETKIIDGIVTQIPVSLTKVTSKTYEQQAREAVDFIEKIRNDRYAILSFSQEVTIEKEAFEYLVNQLNELEKQYLELFTGITVLEDIYETFVVYPDSESALLHICSVIPDVGFSTSISKTQAYNYYLRCTPQALLTLKTDYLRTNAQNPKIKNNTGYRIRKTIPVYISLVQGDKEELLGVFPIYQFGLLETLPANLDGFDIGEWSYVY